MTSYVCPLCVAQTLLWVVVVIGVFVWMHWALFGPISPPEP